MDRDRLSLYWLKKSPLVYSQAKGQGPLRQATILITKARKNESKKQFLMESELASLQQFPTVEVHSTIVWEKGCNDHSGLVRWIFLGVYAIFASVTKVETCLPFVPLGTWHSPGDLPVPGIKFRSSALQTDSLPSEPRGKPKLRILNSKSTISS